MNKSHSRVNSRPNRKRFAIHRLRSMIHKANCHTEVADIPGIYKPLSSPSLAHHSLVTLSASKIDADLVNNKADVIRNKRSSVKHDRSDRYSLDPDFRLKFLESSSLGRSPTNNCEDQANSGLFLSLSGLKLGRRKSEFDLMANLASNRRKSSIISDCSSMVLSESQCSAKNESLQFSDSSLNSAQSIENETNDYETTNCLDLSVCLKQTLAGDTECASRTPSCYLSMAENRCQQCCTEFLLENPQIPVALKHVLEKSAEDILIMRHLLRPLYEEVCYPTIVCCEPISVIRINDTQHYINICKLGVDKLPPSLILRYHKYLDNLANRLSTMPNTKILKLLQLMSSVFEKLDVIQSEQQLVLSKTRHQVSETGRAEFLTEFRLAAGEEQADRCLLYVEQLIGVVSLLLSLCVRHTCVIDDSVIYNLHTDQNVLRNKQTYIESQITEAKQLKSSIDARGAKLLVLFKHYLSDEHVTAFKQHLQTCVSLTIQSFETAERLRLAYTQLSQLLAVNVVI